MLRATTHRSKAEQWVFLNACFSKKGRQAVVEAVDEFKKATGYEGEPLDGDDTEDFGKVATLIADEHQGNISKEDIEGWREEIKILSENKQVGPDLRKQYKKIKTVLKYEV